MSDKYIFSGTLITLLVLCAMLPVKGIADWRIVDETLVIDELTDSIPAFQFLENDEFSEIRFLPRPDAKSLKIGAYAFLGCKSLRRVELPNFVDELGEGCFKECCALESLELSEGLRGTPRYMAAWCTSLKEVKIPDSIEKIGAHSFAYCSELREFRFPENLRIIENNAFSRCCSLTDIRLPDSVTALESYVFSDCTSLRTAKLPNNGSMLGELIFSGCESLIEIIEPSMVIPTFDCNSSLFEPDDETAYDRCTLIVPQDALQGYKKTAGWELFNKLNSIRH